MNKGMFTIGPDNYYGYYDYCDGTKEELEEALIRFEDGYNYTCFCNKDEHPNWYDWEKTANKITLKKGHMEIGRHGVALNTIYIQRK